VSPLADTSYLLAPIIRGICRLARRAPPHDLHRPAAIGGGKDNFGAPNMLLILRPTAMPRTARSAALLDMGASTDSGRASQAGDPSNLANAICD
jgi:hypothetical protein